jgi:hypothetical protein
MLNQELEKSASLEKQISENARHFSKEVLKFILKEIVDSQSSDLQNI